MAHHAEAITTERSKDKFLAELHIIIVGEKWSQRDLIEKFNLRGNEVLCYGTPAHPDLIARAKSERIDVMIICSASREIHHGTTSLQIEDFRKIQPNTFTIAVHEDAAEGRSNYVDQLEKIRIKSVDMNLPNHHRAAAIVKHIANAGLLAGENLEAARNYTPGRASLSH